MIIGDIRKDLDSRIRKAMNGVNDRACEVVKEAIHRFYEEYDPEYYERTFQLYNAIEAGVTWKKDNHFQTSVLFDSKNLDYSRKSFKEWKDGNGGYYNPFAPHQRSSDGWFENTGYDNSIILDNALHGDRPHGGFASGKGIRNEITNLLRGRMSRIYKEELKKAGIPIK